MGRFIWPRVARLWSGAAENTSFATNRRHIELRRQALVHDGMDPRDAAYEARRMFGNVTNIREQSREAWSFPVMQSVVQDVRYGARLLWRAPLFTLVAVSSIAFGLAGGLIMFTVTMRGLPPSQARSQACTLYTANRRRRLRLDSYADHADFAKATSTCRRRSSHARSRERHAARPAAMPRRHFTPVLRLPRASGIPDGDRETPRRSLVVTVRPVERQVARTRPHATARRDGSRQLSLCAPGCYEQPGIWRPLLIARKLRIAVASACASRSAAPQLHVFARLRTASRPACRSRAQPRAVELANSVRWPDLSKGGPVASL